MALCNFSINGFLWYQIVRYYMLKKTNPCRMTHCFPRIIQFKPVIGLPVSLTNSYITILCSAACVQVISYFNLELYERLVLTSEDTPCPGLQMYITAEDSLWKPRAKQIFQRSGFKQFLVVKCTHPSSVNSRA